MFCFVLGQDFKKEQTFKAKIHILMQTDPTLIFVVCCILSCNHQQTSHEQRQIFYVTIVRGSDLQGKLQKDLLNTILLQAISVYALL